ncbi:nuclear transport factor 2 family protein [Aurantiacibacter marinus]|uniref:SnoaL-like domain-containing protein n=1 Tax=Aurantiacibacter marinus TaxID=874156 RepID=A0A0H0XMV0_9SPHN|nr:nuclear transport factor 2 family protein [Aurantiacibacter marinus]KLI63306.1 hypothetical protein AAV99_11635 [Aurantiacibacter marinus]
MQFWRPITRKAIVRRYVQAINAKDLGAIEKLTCPDFSLIDTAGIEVSGRKDCIEVLRGLSRHAPDYRIEVSALSKHGDDVLVSGKAHSTVAGIRRATQWRARFRQRKLAEWHSYGAYPPSTVRAILSDEQMPDVMPDARG